jgi:tRNA dimethylallyltransferase
MIQARKRLPMITGGTGQYYRALMEGWQIPALAPNEPLRSALLEWGTEIGKEALHARLAILDPQAAMEIDPSNLRRTIRALEVIFLTGERFSTLRKKSGPLFNYYVIGLTMPRENLYHRVDDRIEDMVSRGLIEEVQRLLNQGYSSSLSSFSAIGYRESAQYLRGEISLEQAKALMKKNTRQLIRRQANWFKFSDPQIHWYEAEPYPANKMSSDLIAAGIPRGTND